MAYPFPSNYPPCGPPLSSLSGERKRVPTDYCSFFLCLGPEMKRFLIFDGSGSIPISCLISPSAPKIRTCTIEQAVYYSCGGSACEQLESVIGG